jgi:F-type H+-transporting ATPase subunit b
LRVTGVLLLLLPIALFSSEGGSGATDILPRTINFLIFAGILYYLLADTIKSYFVGRADSIAERLESVQEKLQEAKDQREEAVKAVDRAKESAEQIVATAKKEADILINKIDENLQSDLANLEKSFGERIEIEEKKTSRDVIENVMNEVFESENLGVSNQEIAQILKKKVA